ncbi:hypothetical protein PUN28_003354 [Cardiocondyla obscurior]|uniref:Uncharacterized protein n=1 Tax=Cardiocondyla obscurior TaxID=286306 RepID=A0AAW2GKI7_9HYME
MYRMSYYWRYVSSRTYGGDNKIQDASQKQSVINKKAWNWTHHMKSLQWLQKVGCLKKRGMKL